MSGHPGFNGPPSSRTPPPLDMGPAPVVALTLDEFLEHLDQLLEDPPPPH